MTWPQGAHNVKKEDVESVKQEVMVLRLQKHAIEFHENYDFQGKLLSAHVFHYLTCTACAVKQLEEQHGKGNLVRGGEKA